MPRIGGTSIWIDEFRRCQEGRSLFFLTHVHAGSQARYYNTTDHISGLSQSFTDNIYCSTLTAKLLEIELNFEVPRNLVCCELAEPRHVLDSVMGPMEFEFFDSCHIPGSVGIIFRSVFGVDVYLGDFRYTGAIEEHIRKRAFMTDPERARIRDLYFDPTFADSHSKFPSKWESCVTLSKFLNSISSRRNVSLLFNWLGTEELVEVAAAAFPREIIGIRNPKRFKQVVASLPFLTGRFVLANGHTKPHPRIIIGHHPQKDSLTLRASTMYFRVRAGFSDASEKSTGKPLLKKVRPNYYRLKWAMHCDIFELRKIAQSLQPQNLFTICPRVEKGAILTTTEMFQLLLPAALEFPPPTQNEDLSNENTEPKKSHAVVCKSLKSESHKPSRLNRLVNVMEGTDVDEDLPGESPLRRKREIPVIEISD